MTAREPDALSEPLLSLRSHSQSARPSFILRILDLDQQCDPPEEDRDRHQNPHDPAHIPPPSLDFFPLALHLRTLSPAQWQAPFEPMIRVIIAIWDKNHMGGVSCVGVPRKCAFHSPEWNASPLADDLDQPVDGVRRLLAVTFLRRRARLCPPYVLSRGHQPFPQIPWRGRGRRPPRKRAMRGRAYHERARHQVPRIG